MNPILAVIKQVRQEPKAFQSDWARANAHHVAEAASRGYITCITNGMNSGRWMVTNAGMKLAQSQGAI